MIGNSSSRRTGTPAGLHASPSTIGVGQRAGQQACDHRHLTVLNTETGEHGADSCGRRRSNEVVRIPAVQWRAQAAVIVFE